MSLSNSDWIAANGYLAEIKQHVRNLEIELGNRKAQFCRNYFDKITTAAQKGLAELTPMESSCYDPTEIRDSNGKGL